MARSLGKSFTLKRVVIGALIFVAAGFLYAAGSDLYSKVFKKKTSEGDI